MFKVLSYFRNPFSIFTSILLALILALTTSVAQSHQQSKEHSPSQYQQQTPLRIAVASNFSPILESLLVEFTEQTKIETQLISSATGILYQQIKHGAPFDVFLSADNVRPKKLADDKLILTGSLQPYAYGQLALWSAKPANRLSLDFLQTAKISKNSSFLNRLAIANPNIAPYGKAAKQVLTRLGLWESYQNKLIIGLNINQTFQQVRSQAVNAGIVAYSQLMINNLKGFLIPQDYYPPIKQSMVILKNSKQQANALIFSQYLLSQKTQQRIKTFGYHSISDIAGNASNNKGSSL